jgi:hypothetical protein
MIEAAVNNVAKTYHFASTKIDPSARAMPAPAKTKTAISIRKERLQAS